VRPWTPQHGVKKKKKKKLLTVLNTYHHLGTEFTYINWIERWQQYLEIEMMTIRIYR
jgi:hypothetical protein